MANSRIAAVFGATGTQGSAVIEGLLQDGTFSIRAITRNPEGSAAKALQARGVVVVKGDLEDPTSLIPALEGSECVFAVTQPNVNHTSEYEMGKNVVDASKAVGVKFFVWRSARSFPFLACPNCALT